MFDLHGGTAPTMSEHTGLAELNLLDRLRAGLDTLRAAGRVPLGGAVSDVELTQAVQMLEAAARVCQGIKLAMVDEIEQRHAARGQAAGSTSDLLARMLHLAPGEARAQAELAAGLALVPDTAAALRDGRIGVGQAAVTVRKADEVKTRDDAHELLAKIDATASTAGQRLDRNRLAREIDTTIARAGVDVLAERERTAHTRRRLDITTRDGMTIVHAELDPYAGAQVRAALDVLSRKDGDADTRTFVQRQADALVEMATMARTAMPEGTALSSRVLLITTPEALHGAEGAEPSLLDGHGPVSTGLARQICCDAEVRTVTTDRNGRILDVGDNKRDPSDKQRAAVIARDKHCVGCGATVSRCQIHHIHWWSRGGATTLDNLALVCWTCHQHLHQQGWEVTKDATGRYRAGPPPHLDNSIANTAHSH